MVWRFSRPTNPPPRRPNAAAPPASIGSTPFVSCNGEADQDVNGNGQRTPDEREVWNGNTDMGGNLFFYAPSDGKVLLSHADLSKVQSAALNRRGRGSTAHLHVENAMSIILLNILLVAGPQVDLPELTRRHEEIQSQAKAPLPPLDLSMQSAKSQDTKAIGELANYADRELMLLVPMSRVQKQLWLDRGKPVAPKPRRDPRRRALRGPYGAPSSGGARSGDTLRQMSRQDARCSARRDLRTAAT